MVSRKRRWNPEAVWSRGSSANTLEKQFCKLLSCCSGLPCVPEICQDHPCLGAFWIGMFDYLEHSCPRSSPDGLFHIIQVSAVWLLPQKSPPWSHTSPSPNYLSRVTITMGNHLFYLFVLSRSVVSDSSWPHGLQPTRLFCPWRFSSQEYWSGLPCSPPGDLPSPWIKPRSPTLPLLLPSEPPGKPFLSQAFTLIHFLHIQLCLGVSFLEDLD